MSNFRVLLLTLALFAVAVPAFSQDATKCDELSAELATTPGPPASTSAIRLSKQLVSNVPKDPQIVLVGDSLFQNWNRTLDKDLPNKTVWNFSVGGDRTQQVLWRLNQLDVKGQNPDVVVIFIGTNNLGEGGADACGILTGIKAVVKKSRELWVNSTIFVVTLSPRGADFLQYDPIRLSLNQGIQTLGKEFPNLYPVVLPDKDITSGQYGKPALKPNTLTCSPESAYRSANFMDDNLHFNEPAYKILRKALSDASLRNLGKDVFSK